MTVETPRNGDLYIDLGPLEAYGCMQLFMLKITSREQCKIFEGDFGSICSAEYYCAQHFPGRKVWVPHEWCPADIPTTDAW